MQVAKLIARGILWLPLAGMAFAAPLPGQPAVPPKITHPMRVVIARDGRAGCEPACAEWIAAQGQIGPDTPAQFTRAFKAIGNRKLPIFISSSGGSVPAALAVGAEIRKRGLAVAVERSLFKTCAANDPTCQRLAPKDGDPAVPEPIGAFCASACAFILAAGVERVVPVYGYVGVHQMVEFQTFRRELRRYQIGHKFENWHVVETRRLVEEKELGSVTVEKDPSYAPVRKYLATMGIDVAKIMPLMLSASHKDIHRMTPEERRATRLVTREAAGDGVLLPPVPVNAPPDAAAGTQAAAGTATAPGKPLPVGWQGVIAPQGVTANLMMLYPPGGASVDLFLRLQSPLGAPQRSAGFSAQLEFADGTKLAATSTGDGISDPLYAPLSESEFCALHAAGKMALKAMLLRGPPQPLKQLALFDMARMSGMAAFAAQHCGR